jgi:hypothetical protein
MPQQIYSRDKSPQFWVGTRKDPDVFKKRQISCPCQESIHDPSVVHLRLEFALNERKIRR